MKISSFAAHSVKAKLQPHTIERRALGRSDVLIEIEYCGVCHTDLHFVNNDWGMTEYPVVPGHEIVGRVSEVGPEVEKFKVGDFAAIGCMVNSCGECSSCKSGIEQYCLQGFSATYNAPVNDPGGFTFGGYSQRIVADESFVLNLPENLSLSGAAPLLCAGITTYSPLQYWTVETGMKVGVVGLGGLGHMGVKFSHAMGAHTVMITSTPEKGEDAKILGADEVLVSTDGYSMNKEVGEFDFILNTIPVDHNIGPYMDLLKVDGTMCVVGAVEPLKQVNAAQLIFGRKKLSGSLIGGIQQTQEMLNFCGNNNIVSEVEIIKMDQIQEAFERLVKSQVKYRFVIDIKSMANA
ncbi:MAG: hydroxyacid dehydrogenase [Verrucomicrobia bacterium TMED44]|nr:MAG: hydroxyacid dehydrogenase [Verrucomicrobia bacterium TMED44]